MSLLISVPLPCRTTADCPLPVSRARNPEHQDQHRPHAYQQHTRNHASALRPMSSPKETTGTNSAVVSSSLSDPSDASPARTAHSAATERDKAVEDMARSGLSKFFQQGVESTQWQVFAESEVRLVYIGTPASNLAHLIQLKRLPPHTFHFPHPPLGPPLAWQPESIKSQSGSLDIADDAGCLPAQEVRDALVKAYFTKIHPGFPIIEESVFMAQYRDRTRPPSLLIFQAVLLAGAHACEHPLVASSRFVVMRTLYRRASLLFHLRHENDRLHMVQAALLFTWHLENADTVCSGSYYWLGIASRIAHGMGLHRNLSPQAKSLLPASERRMYRRIWWVMFQAEIFSCLEHGRPCTISLNDIDQPELEPEDFMEGDDEHISETVNFDYCQKNVRLCFIILQILSLNSPRAPAPNPSTISSIETALASFAFDLPSTSSFWSYQLRMHYNLVLLHLHRTESSVDGSTMAFSFNNTKSQEICSDASHSILACMETICNRRWVDQCPFTGVSAVMAAAIQITNDAKSALSQGSALLALSAQDRLFRLLEFARELDKYWPSAGAVHRLFNELSDELKHLARNVQTSVHEVSSDSVPDLILGWDRTFNYSNFTLPTDFDVDEWMNDTGFLQVGLG